MSQPDVSKRRWPWHGSRVPLIVILVIVLLIAGLLWYPRSLSHDVSTWHVDPLTAAKPSTPNSYRIGPEGTESADAEAPTFSQDSTSVGEAFSEMVNGQSSVEILAGSEADGFVTYVHRTTVFGFPDYISVRFIDLDDGGSTIAVFSRSRLGQSDLGVNEKRVTEWIAALQATLG